jgi:hypothetical protein
MRIKDYSTLKSASKISLSKDGDIVKLTQKRYDSNTGEAIADNVSEIDLEMYKNDKAHKENEKALIETEITELGKIIADIEAL